MFDIVRYSPERAGEWNRFVAESKNGTFLFDRGYMDYHADRFADHSLMFYNEKTGKLYALLPANRHGDVLYSHQGLSYGGLVMSTEVTTANVCQLFGELNIYLSAEGFCKVMYKAIPWFYHRVPSEEDLYALSLVCKAQLAGRDVSSTIIPVSPVKWKRDRRYAANKAKRTGIVVRQNDDFSEFWKILSDNLSEKFNARPVHTLQEIELLHSRFPENILLWEAYSSDGDLLAGTVIYKSYGVVHSQYISASPEGKRLHAVDALYDYLIHHAYATAKYIDLGTSNMPHSNDLHESLIYQKEGFGGRAVCCDTYEWTL